MKTVITHADISQLYRDVPQLAGAAQIIVRGKIVDVSYFDEVADSALQTYTKVTVRVDQSLKGSFSPGSTTTFVFSGGVTSAAKLANYSDIPPTASNSASSSQLVRVLFEGAPLPAIGEEVVYFGDRGDIGSLAGSSNAPEIYFQTVGAFQGAFSVTGGMAERFVPKALSSTGLDPLRMQATALASAITSNLSS